MKKSILMVGTLLLLASGMSSCGEEKALDINVAELDSACDFVDALGKVVDEMTVMVEDNELSTEEEGEFKKLIEKGDEISEAASAKHERTEAEKCPNWETFRKKSEKLEEYM